MTASIAASPSATPRAGHLRPLPTAAPSRSVRLVAQQEGQLQVHTAPFRGSFSGVLSQALRSAGLGSRVLVSQFLKGGVDQGLERSVWLCGRLQWLRPAVSGCLMDPAVPGEAGQADRDAVLEIWTYTREQLLSGQLEQLVLDELGLAIELGYLPEADVVQALEQRHYHLDVILTGPSMPSSLLAMADQVTQLRRGF
ncbi:MAG: cob(I)yrinic acid a,c-diamide adenosyltransferase [Vulcanococcus sp.]